MQKPSSENNLFMVSDKGTHNIYMLIDSISFVLPLLQNVIFITLFWVLMNYRSKVPSCYSELFCYKGKCLTQKELKETCQWERELSKLRASFPSSPGSEVA